MTTIKAIHPKRTRRPAKPLCEIKSITATIRIDPATEQWFWMVEERYRSLGLQSSRSAIIIKLIKDGRARIESELDSLARTLTQDDFAN